jgi:hypothetical protein
MAAKDPFAVEATVMPSFGGSQNVGEYDPKKYVVKYYKADLDDPEQRLMLSELETNGIRNEGIVLLKKDNFVFMDKFFIVVQYMEKIRASTN